VAYQEASKQQIAQGNNRNIQLKEVKVKAAAAHNLRGASPNSSNLNGPGNADQVITGKELENQGPDLTFILQGMIAGVRTNGGKVISARGGSLNRPGVMLIVLDGAYYSGALSNINPSDIASLEVLKSASNTALYGSRGAAGVIVITTKRFGDDGGQKAANAASYTVPGFYKARVFYSPDYDNSKEATITGRSTIYWNPNIVTDKDGNAGIRYFNDMSKSTYTVIVEGISLEGKIGRQVFTYKVE
jgi:TonB-dependent SusC/RagA subfamily outer membrane receptor